MTKEEHKDYMHLLDVRVNSYWNAWDNGNPIKRHYYETINSYCHYIESYLTKKYKGTIVQIPINYGEEGESHSVQTILGDRSSTMNIQPNSQYYLECINCETLEIRHVHFSWVQW